MTTSIIRNYDRLLSVGIEPHPKIEDSLLERRLRFHMDVTSKSHKWTGAKSIKNAIYKGESSKFVKGIEEIVRENLEDRLRFDGSPEFSHHEAIIEKILPNFYNGDIWQSYSDWKYKEFDPDRFQMGGLKGLKNNPLLAFTLMDVTFLLYTLSLGSIDIGLIKETSNLIFTGTALFAGIFHLIAYAKGPYARINSSKERAYSAIKYFEGTKIPIAAGVIAAILAHDSDEGKKEERYWKSINNFIEDGNFGTAGVFVRKVVNLVTRKEAYIERVTQYFDEITNYLNKNNTDLRTFINKPNKTEDGKRVEDKLRIISIYRHATIEENQFQPSFGIEDVIFNDKELDRLEEIREIVKNKRYEKLDNTKYFKEKTMHCKSGD